MITIQSSWGVVTTDDEGIVVEVGVLEVDSHGERCYLLDVEKFDLKEHQQWWENRFTEPYSFPDDFDVLDLGFWKKDGSYEEADKKWRDNIYDKSDK